MWNSFLKGMFRLDAEDVHRLAMFMIRHLGWQPDRGKYHLGEGAPVIAGLRFRNPIGLAAGFDKNCEILHRLAGFGFGFAEIGTVTPLPQPGNPRPRLFRDLATETIFNRMGFNSDGAQLVAERLKKARDKLPLDFRVGVNIGKNKDTPMAEASADYRRAIGPFRDLADYICINVSSPNTEGLRGLQNVRDLSSIVEAVALEITGWTRVPPIFLKLAPELEAETLNSMIPELDQCGVAGWILTNTLAGKWRVDGHTELAGGISGAPLKARSEEVLRTVRKLTDRPIISSGGILTAEDAVQRLAEGAQLIQIYSGWIFEGPGFPREILKFLPLKQQRL